MKVSTNFHSGGRVHLLNSRNCSDIGGIHQLNQLKHTLRTKKMMLVVESPEMKYDKMIPAGDVSIKYRVFICFNVFSCISHIRI